MFPKLSSLLGRSDIVMCSVDLGKIRVSIPVADIKGERPGKTLLVTGGVDGDEYTGIQAAYELIEVYRKRNFAGRLIIIPIVNLPGFEVGCSENPLDGQFPKSVFPGKENGSPTERLVYWLAKNYAFESDVWFDLHGGALSERLNPFLWTYETGVASVDGWMKNFHTSQTETVLFEKASASSKASRLAKKGCAYVMAESGERGLTRPADVRRHIDWVTCAMESLEMIPSRTKKTAKQKPTIFRHLSFVYAPCDGLWMPSESLCHSREGGNPGNRQTLPIKSTGMDSRLRRNDLLGAYRKMNELQLRELYAKRDGHLLWRKETMPMKKGEILCAFAA